MLSTDSQGKIGNWRIGQREVHLASWGPPCVCVCVMEAIYNQHLGRWLAEARKTAKKQPIASSSMPPSSIEAKGQSSEWSLLPPMIEERSRCAAVNIPDSGVLVIGGMGKNRLPLRSTELLTRRPNDVGGGGGEKWQWLPYTPMNEEHDCCPLAVYFQGRVYVVGCGEYVNKMEMLDVTAGSQWTSLTFFRQRLEIQSMAIVGNELFVSS
ncbi:unnamed protein product [Hymenolepis diminuta]|uniref:Kelch repeat-containing protein n=1 Tax=Hymenolepis diminuta TaxID=6216 RepID=A0A0R3SYY9_HYMDI|nr:unnamed protein product [Hymenolepis diminuta]